MAKKNKIQKTQKLNPKQSFVVLTTTTTRKAIADSLNEYLGRDEFKSNDGRLTDAICKRIAEDSGYWQDEITNDDDDLIEKINSVLDEEVFSVACTKLRVRKEDGEDDADDEDEEEWEY